VKLKFYIFLFVNFLILSSYASEYNSIKHQKLKINTISGETLDKIGMIRGNVDSYPYGFRYFLRTHEGKISELIETFYFENYGDHMSRFNNWARQLLYISNPNNGCNNSADKVYHAVVDNGPTHINCLSVKIIKNFDDVYGPSYDTQHIKFSNIREGFLKKYLNKNSISIPENMFRIESYLYRNGKLIWVFYTIDSKLFFEKINEKNIEIFINNAISIHQNFEKDLKFKNFMKINVLDRLEELFNKGILTKEEFDNTKKKLIN